MKAQALLVSALLAAGQASAGPWTFDGPVAIAGTDTEVKVGVVIRVVDNCDVAELAVSGNYEIDWIGLNVDGTNYGHAEAHYPADGIAVVVAGEGALRALVGGEWAIVVTSEGSVAMSLEGSRRAIEGAYAECLKQREAEIREYVKPLRPTFPAGGVSF